LALQALALLAASKNPLVLTVVTDFWVLQALNFPSWYAERWTMMDLGLCENQAKAAEKNFNAGGAPNLIRCAKSNA